MDGVTAILLRNPSSNQGTTGQLTLKKGAEVFSCHTLELPWRGNISRKSCIPLGTYKWIYNMSPRLKRKLYRALAVPKRDGILIHSAAFAGNTDMGYKSHLLGCIALGRGFGKVGGQLAILNSRVTMKAFEDFCGGLPIYMEIKDA